MNHLYQDCVVKRFGQELHCAITQRKSSHLGVAMRSDEDDGYSASFSLKLRLQFQTGHAWHANVDDQARGLVSGFRIQELFRGTEAECGQPDRFDEILQRPLKRLVVIDDCYES